jgi:hypothetical protein
MRAVQVEYPHSWGKAEQVWGLGARELGKRFCFTLVVNAYRKRGWVDDLTVGAVLGREAMKNRSRMSVDIFAFSMLVVICTR